MFDPKLIDLLKKHNIKVNFANTLHPALYDIKNDKIEYNLDVCYVLKYPPNAVLAHEIIHWTGHKSRLNRWDYDYFTSSQVKYEETIAILGSSLLLQQLNIFKPEYKDLEDRFIMRAGLIEYPSTLGNKILDSINYLLKD